MQGAFHFLQGIHELFGFIALSSAQRDFCLRVFAAIVTTVLATEAFVAGLLQHQIEEFYDGGKRRAIILGDWPRMLTRWPRYMYSMTRSLMTEGRSCPTT